MANNNSRYTDEQLVAAVQESISFRQVLRTLGMYDRGGNYLQLKKRLARIDCDTSHMYGKRHGSSVRPNRLRLEEILVENSYYSSHALKKRLIAEGLMINECVNGHTPEWMGQKMSLHLDHINGVHTDNRLTNLRLLCPNCHSLTETYCRGTRRKKTNSCLDCGKTITVHHERCGPCGGIQRNRENATFTYKTKIKWPDPYDIKNAVLKTSFVTVAQNLNVSDNAVRKFLRLHGIDIKKYKPRK